MSTQLLQNTPLEDIPKAHARLYEIFRSGKTLPLGYRRKQLLQLAHLIQDNVKAIEAAELADLGKPALEVVLNELGPVVQACLRAVKYLEEWAEPEKPPVEEWRSNWDTTIYKAPKGVVLLISPWNYPWILTFNPLVGAIAAGCPVALKPSESSPACSALIAELVPKYLDQDAYIVVNGAVPETTALLDLRWDHIFFTGGGSVGRVVAAAAAKFVTPVTLELGGKSPVIIDSDCDIEVAAKRTLFGKLQNNGQLCVTPDYICVPRAVLPQFKKAISSAYSQFWPNSALHPSSQWGHIVTPNHHTRVWNLIKNTKGEILEGGHVEPDKKKIAPTIVTGVSLDDPLMENENFGPVLPIIEVEDVDEAIDVVRSRPTPLVLYAFTNNEETKQKLLDKTSSGSLILNDTVTQLAVHEIPFGGLGESGYGAYSSKHTFDLFTHRRSSINVPTEFEPNFAFRYPPYSPESYAFVERDVMAKIPDA
ncbi:Aldehyde/histidinol dehydrogenase [Abortiporus biennis]|nr:Aldehyde/histidinol dehydrogenase [Abortiporus biennis]